MSKKILVLLADGFEETEALSPTDVLRRSAPNEVTLVSIKPNDASVTSSHKITIIADSTIDQISASEYDAVILPGGMPGTLNLNSSQAVLDIVQQAYSEGKIVAAICAAPMILGGLGILADRKATCFPGFEQYLTGATHIRQHVVRDGNVITGVGAGASILFGLEILKALDGEERADKIAHDIQLIL
ncbi:MAG: DJ-1/PfpI family protein [Marinilabiliaceae bacterium]|nr:DJ-1/PfpI family protein [Marinilabiliaceae bacterium]